jgi:hypothetical protein
LLHVSRVERAVVAHVRSSVLRRATPFPLERTAVTGCLDLHDHPSDAIFAMAFERSLAALAPLERRGALGGITGHVAESVVEVMLADHGWSPVWHFIGPGRHGVDLLVLDPGQKRLFAVEIKGTLRPRHWPRLKRSELTQMAVEWLDKQDNPAMHDWGLTSADVYGGIVLVNFQDLLFKVTLTADFSVWYPVVCLEQLDHLDWLDGAARGADSAAL